MTQDPNGTDWFSPQGDPMWPEQPRTVLRPDDQSWRHPADPGPTPAPVEPPHPNQPLGDPTAQWPPEWGAPQLPPQQQPPSPQQSGYWTGPAPEPVPPQPPAPAPRPVQPGPPPGSVAWLQQHYPAPGERPARDLTGGPAQPVGRPLHPDPYGQPQPPAAEPVSAFAPRPPGIPEPRPAAPTVPTRHPMRVLLLAGGATLLVAVVVVAAMFFGRSSGGAAAPNDPHPSDGAVRFLEAVAAGDSARALSLQQQPPADRTLLTDQVLRESRQRAPISRIRVTRETPTEVELTYQLGEAEVRGEFVPVRQSDGSYKVERGTTTVQVTRPRSVPVLANGVRLQANEVAAFPGAYELSTGMPNITFAETQFTVSGPTSFPRLAPAVTLTDAGRTAMLDATRRALDGCMRAKELNPPNCPQRIELKPNQRPDNNTVRWELSEDPLVNQVPRLSISEDTTAELRLTVKARLSLTVLTDGRPGTVTGQQMEFATRAVAPMTSGEVTARFVN